MVVLAVLALATAAACAPEPVTNGGGAPGTAARPPASTPGGTRPPASDRGVLLFTRTAAFHHDSITAATAALTTALPPLGFTVTVTDDPAMFAADRLGAFAAVVFLSTTGDVLDDAQQTALEAWVEAGGGWVGVHSALDTEYDWPFYETLAGAHFASHPEVQTATVRVEDANHEAMRHLPATWSRADEWYNTRTNPRGHVHVLATVDESTYQGGAMGADHPIVWCARIGRGQSFTTAMGHTDESWTDPTFVDHVTGGIDSVTRADACPA